MDYQISDYNYKKTNHNIDMICFFLYTIFEEVYL